MFLNLINTSPTFDGVRLQTTMTGQLTDALKMIRAYKTRFKHTTKLLTREKAELRGR